MGTSYFSAENAWRHLFFVTGLTADEFYTDGGLKLNLEQITHLELKRSGYERIVFYDRDNKLYCYDDDSYRLMHVNGGRQERDTAAAEKVRHGSARSVGGLKRGKHAHAARSTSGSAHRQEEGRQPVHRNKTAQQKWEKGRQSGILIRQGGDGPLHLGMHDKTFIERQINSYLHDGRIKTAVVINDASEFLDEFGKDMIHALTVRLEQLGTDNENILIFLYRDGSLGNIYQTEEYDAEKQDQKDINHIEISYPNAAELRNMLMYLHINDGLQFKMRDLKRLSLALAQATSLGESRIRIKELYIRLKSCSERGKILTEEECYTLLGTKKPESARTQLAHLIGMEKVKDALSKYDIPTDPLAVFDHMTASRLQQPDPIRDKEHQEMIHFALLGNPGTGKTTAAKLIGQLFFEMGYLEDGHVVEADRSRLVGEHVGETALKTRQRVEEALGGVLFIDEAYSLKREGNSGNDFGQEAIDTLTKLMDEYKGKFITVAAGYPKEMEVFIDANPGLSRRFRTLYIDDYTPEEMCRILQFHARKNHARFSDEFKAQLPNFCENWVNLAGEDWGNAGEAVKLMDNMVRAWKTDPKHRTVRGENGEELSLLTTAYIPQELAGYLTPADEMRRRALDQLNQMTGLREVKRTVERLRRRMIAGDMDVPGHYIFAGNPGTGKTTVARYMGQILRSLGMLRRGQLIEYTATDLMSVVFNDQNNGDFPAVANEALGGVLFIDEAYQLTSNARGRAILDALLPFMENNRKNLCVIAAGYEDDMRDFLDTNQGFKTRFTETIHFENYSGDELQKILMDMLAKKGITADEGYQENARRALTRYVEQHGGDRDFGNARFVRTYFLPASLDAQTDRLMRKYGENFPHELKKVLTAEDIPNDMVRYTRTPLSEQDTHTAMEDINSLIGFDELKQKLRDMLQLGKAASEPGNEDLLDNQNFHWILRGNPGTGKTTAAKLIGKVYKEMGLLSRGHTVKVTRTDLVGEYMGQTAIRTQRCIDRAMGGVLFIDEAYSLKRKGSSGDDYGQEAIDTILEQMSDKNGEFAVIAAGYPAEMDVFLDSNPGFRSRFGEDFLIRDYTADELLQIFKLKCRKKKFYLDADTEEVIRRLFANMIAARIPGWANGREAENLERKMRSSWAYTPVKRTDEESGEERRYYTSEHIPEEYRKYLSENTPETAEEKQPAYTFHLPADKLAAPAGAFNYDNRYKDQSGSVVFIRTAFPNGVASGSGSIITADGYILTCSHVVAGSPDIRVRIKRTEEDAGEVSWEKAEIVWADADLDIALIKIRDGKYPALSLRPLSEKIQPGEEIYLIGYPFGGMLSDNLDELAPSMYSGTVSSVQIKDAVEQINVNMEGKRGCSGGPVFSKKDGCIAGVFCGSVKRGDDDLMEEINYIRPVKYVWQKVVSGAEQEPGD